MSGSNKDWIFVVVFFAIFLAMTLGEIYLLSRKGVAIRRAMIFVFSSNFVTITVGFFVTLLIFGLILAATGNDDPQTPGGEVGKWGLFLVALLFPVFLMTVVRRLLIPSLRIDQVGMPLSYSIASTLAFFAVVVGVPALFLYLL